jgi:hypothetical protein
MGKLFETLTADLRTWLAQQKLFFVATAPNATDGHINCSPKAGDTFRVLSDREVAYLDLTGSGIETVAHLQENGRIVVMFCAFEGPPKIVRLHGMGTVIYPGDAEYAHLNANFPIHPGARAVIRIALTRVSDSCGYGVPLLDFARPRDTLDRWTEKKGPDGLIAYREAKNRASIDGIPGYKMG